MHLTIAALSILIASAWFVVPDPAYALSPEQIEDLRLLDAMSVTRTRYSAAAHLAYAKECEAAFVIGEPIPFSDIRSSVDEIDEDLLEMTSEEILQQSGDAFDLFWDAQQAIRDCELKYRKREQDGS